MLTLEGLAKGHITQGSRGKIWVLQARLEDEA